jgi:hypothetical protein
VIGEPGSSAEPEQLRGLALTCVALMVLSVLALVSVDGRERATPRRTGLLTAGGDFDYSGPGAGVPPSLTPLFPATTSSLPAKGALANTTTAAQQQPAAAALPPPALGVYTYAVAGDEAMTGFGSRKLPETMKLTAHRPGALAADELVLDLWFSDLHSESLVVGFGSDAVSLRQSTLTVMFGPVTRTSAASYSPSVGRAALPFVANAVRTGVSPARDPAGQVERTEDWKVTDVAPRAVAIAGTPTTAWEIVVERTSRPGATEQLRETGRAWFDPARRMWVRWETHLRTQRTEGVTFTYDLNYVATLTSFAAS